MSKKALIITAAMFTIGLASADERVYFTANPNSNIYTISNFGPYDVKLSDGYTTIYTGGMNFDGTSYYYYNVVGKKGQIDQNLTDLINYKQLRNLTTFRNYSDTKLLNFYFTGKLKICYISGTSFKDIDIPITLTQMDYDGKSPWIIGTNENNSNLSCSSTKSNYKGNTIECLYQNPNTSEKFQVKLRPIENSYTFEISVMQIQA